LPAAFETSFQAFGRTFPHLWVRVDGSHYLRKYDAEITIGCDGSLQVNS
jgi:hypothetical protein